jgi:uncharacterized OsmC-like protein
MNIALARSTAPFQEIDRDRLAALGEKGRSDPTDIRTVRCRTVAEGKRFRHLNFVRNLPPHVLDEPPALLGDDTAPNPSEALLAALGTCVAVGLQANAVARGFGVRHIGVELEADINITSVWGTGDLNPKPVGFEAIRLRVELDLDGASEAEKKALIEHAVQWSPVLNTVRNPVDVSVVPA